MMLVNSLITNGQETTQSMSEPSLHRGLHGNYRSVLLTWRLSVQCTACGKNIPKSCLTFSEQPFGVLARHFTYLLPACVHVTAKGHVAVIYQPCW